MVVPAQVENSSPILLVITEAYVEAGEVVTSGGTTGKGKYVPFTDEGELIREVKFTAKATNQSAYPITLFSVAIQNPAFLSDEVMIVGLSRKSEPDEHWADLKYVMKPQDALTFSATLYIRERKNGRELMDHLSDFRLKVLVIMYESKRATIARWQDDSDELGVRGTIGGGIDDSEGLLTTVSYVYPKSARRGD